MRHVITFLSVLALGCGPQSGDDPDGAGEGESEGEGEGESEGEGEGEGEVESEGEGESGDPGPLEWEDLEERRGWMEILGTNGAAWIEEDHAVLPACDSTLVAADGSAGLAYASASGDPTQLEPVADPWTETEVTNIGDIAPRPGLAAVSAVFLTYADGVVAETDADPRFTRWVDLDPTSGEPPLYLRVCDTAFARGHCVAPGPDFPFEGCIGVEGEEPGFTLTPTFTRDGDDWVFVDSAGYECNTDELAAGHPADVALGSQTVRVTAGDIADGDTVEITADMLRWESSYKSAEDCHDVRDKGSVCTCTWDYRESITIERGTLMRVGDRVYIDLKGGGDDAAYLFWGRFPVDA
jgi:hypothetical protein